MVCLQIAKPIESFPHEIVASFLRRVGDDEIEELGHGASQYRDGADSGFKAFVQEIFRTILERLISRICSVMVAKSEKNPSVSAPEYWTPVGHRPAQSE
jgi:hypothetical protein